MFEKLMNQHEWLFESPLPGIWLMFVFALILGTARWALGGLFDLLGIRWALRRCGLLGRRRRPPPPPPVPSYDDDEFKRMRRSG
jgi:hypothetical protein